MRHLSPPTDGGDDIIHDYWTLIIRAGAALLTNCCNL